MFLFWLHWGFSHWMLPRRDLLRIISLILPWERVGKPRSPARRTIQGYEAMHMIRKGQVRWVSGSGVRRQIQFINRLFEVAA